MFGVSLPELLVIFVVALLLFGPEQLPQIARTLGKLMGEFRKNSDSLRREFYNAVYPPAEELKRQLDSERRNLTSIKSEIVNEQKKIESAAAQLSAEIEDDPS